MLKVILIILLTLCFLFPILRLVILQKRINKLSKNWDIPKDRVTEILNELKLRLGKRGPKYKYIKDWDYKKLEDHYWFVVNNTYPKEKVQFMTPKAKINLEVQTINKN